MTYPEERTQKGRTKPEETNPKQIDEPRRDENP